MSLDTLTFIDIYTVGILGVCGAIICAAVGGGDDSTSENHRLLQTDSASLEMAGNIIAFKQCCKKTQAKCRPRFIYVPDIFNGVYLDAIVHRGSLWTRIRALF